ncbi:hypothetical protein HPC49_27920 [Pyxidicoccus fallax]|uniref:POTRA domain-containing protein n=1 Tax=Pyxidicoccus fallax TaxID=394095 RepID=A0A848LS42_9BACT|nr:hypothetical protein [Pyxidicoccus fallax]NMO20440.1 hypothetical protein [Pyxidicoccus fallax]NPC82032.1 hypothetical protein [Pyxidicoccus fallax]
MNRFALFFCLLALTAVAQPATDAGTSEPPEFLDARPADARDECPDDYDDEDEPEEDASVLAPLQLNVDGRPLTPASLELHGLQRLTDAQVRALIGASLTDPRAQTLLTAARAQTFLRRLARTGLFARVEPRLRVPEQEPVVLEVHLEENPTVTAVELEGLQDIQARELLEELFRLPHRFPDEDEEEDEDVIATLRIDSRRGTLSVVRSCPPPRPPREWLARMERGEFRPGIVLGGTAQALDRALEDLRDDGYLLSSFTATLHPDGRLVVTVDEGRLEAVDVQGVPPDMAARVREALDLKPGDVFLRSDATRAMERLEAHLPFLEAADVDDDEDSKLRRRARIVEERDADGTRRYRTEEAPRKKRRREQVEFELNLRQLVEWWGHEKDGEGITLDGKRLVVHVRPRRPDLDVDLLPVHTQVTGFAPGLAGHLRIWDPKDRAHLTLDAALFIPLRLGGQRLPDDPEGTKRQRRLNLLGGVKAQVPAQRLAELGVQGYDFTDTFDRWRLGDIDSFIYSALLNRPDREYFRRKGFTAFATWRWAESWLTGIEYRGDRYESMRSFTPPLSLFRRDSPPFTNSPVTEGRFKSVVLRLEYASDAPPGAKVGSLFRTPETTLFERDDHWDERASLRGLLTLEVGEGPGAFGADARFWKLVSDVSLEVPTGWESGVRLRVRTAGGDDLPEQKREALGGWTALRGHGFKEFRGDVSLLTTAEYHWGWLGLFADVGSVRVEEAWTEARLGLGASILFGDDVRFDVAWRTDEKATATPEARLLFVQTF